MMIHSTRTTITPRMIQPVVDIGLGSCRGREQPSAEHGRAGAAVAPPFCRCRDLGGSAPGKVPESGVKKRPQAGGLGSLRRTAVRGVRGEPPDGQANNAPVNGWFRGFAIKKLSTASTGRTAALIPPRARHRCELTGARASVPIPKFVSPRGAL